MSEILFEIKNTIGFITLNRPEKFNAFTRPLALQFQEALLQCQNNPQVRCILITGNGKAFCAGQDLAEVVDPNGPDMQKILAEHFNPIVTLIRNMPKPIVAAVNGIAAGAGANIALCCDIVIAADTASFLQAFTKIGLIPDSGGTHTLPRLVGFARASALMLLGDKITATEAQNMGMIYKVTPAETLATEAQKLCNTLAAMPTTALGFTKMALNKSIENNFEAQLETEDELQFKASQTKDFAEGVAAFLEKRQPVFIGS
jgi:2-(1,2-epoxy-1,2-dihydrophenyl)acetyl-CoA isomerase